MGQSMTNPGELAKSYDPAVEEPKVRAKWDAAKPFHAEASADVYGPPPYCILIPPPNVTAALHLGHALNNTLQDVLIRYHRAQGRPTLWMPGTDHAGIATQAVIEKRIWEDQGKRRKDLDPDLDKAREKFVAITQAWKDEYEATIIEQLKMMGCSCDWERTRFTMDEMCARAVREAFFRLFKDGLIYRGKRLVNWDPVLQTAVADDECYDEEIEGQFYYLRYPLIGEPVKLPDGSPIDHITVATTRPETMLGDTGVAVNPKDPRAAALAGRKVKLPLVGREIPIVVDDYVVLPVSMGGDEKDPKAQFATGFLKVTPAHDPNDWEIGQRHSLEAVNIFAPDASVSDKHGWSDIGDAGFLLGLDRFDARKAIVRRFEETGVLAERKPYRHSVSHSDRSKAIIEPYLSDQWYVKVTDDRMRGNALRAMAPDQRSNEKRSAETSRDCLQTLSSSKGEEAALDDRSWHGQLHFHPDRYAKTFENWHENIRDWCISRQLWWGHRIPVWTGSRDASVDLFQTVRRSDSGVLLTNINGQEIPFVESDVDGNLVHVCVLPAEHGWIVHLLEQRGFAQDPDVLDTWFSSALWPLSTMGWPDPESYDETRGDNGAPNLLDFFNPTSVLCTAREIITLWVSRMAMFNLYFTQDTEKGQRLPFRDVFIHAMIQDGEGRKMSKSLGNGVDPRDIIRSKGADAMRFTLVQMTTQTQDVRMPVEYDETIGANTSPKFELGRRLSNKIWNATRFAIGILSNSTGETPVPPSGVPTRLIDRWILSRLARTLDAVSTAMRQYDFSVYAQQMYDLFWRDLCDWYLEAIKPTVRHDATQQRVLRTALGAVHRMFHPIMPFVTESLHASIEALPVKPLEDVDLRPGGLAATAPWPSVPSLYVDDAVEAQFARLQELVTIIREVRSVQKVHDRRQITLHVSDDATMELIRRADGVVEALAGLGKVSRDAAGARGGVTFLFGNVEHQLTDLTDAIDLSAERDRLTRQQAEVQKKIKGLEGRLANKGYIEKAPPKLVEETKQQLAEAQAELDSIIQALERLGS
ncbi:MAG: valine--tRNA ligase [Phycisphaerales bacterium]|nr:valine--tRNA ligase [Phycisphaerales bacterium]